MSNVQYRTPNIEVTHRASISRFCCWTFFIGHLLLPSLSQAQDPSNPGPHPAYIGRTLNRAPGQQGSPNMTVLSHIPGGGFTRLTNLDIEQEVSRPYVYLGRRWKPS